ncbi:hypothetical protein EPN81_04070 [Patescibacteria group bacterium]|nr:MAG: hypothetical protein EPN81_04070 [Patescibacteria group bacterium]
MKPFQTLLLLVILILIGGMAALYWGKSIEDVTAPVEVVAEPVVEPIEEETEPVSYLVFESSEVTDPGTQDWANDDTETYTFYHLALGASNQENLSADDLVAFAQIVHPSTVSGGLTTYVYGQQLLMHRYQEENQDGILSLEGEVVETRPEQWSSIRSANGRYEVSYTTRFDDSETERSSITEIQVVDRETSQEMLRLSLDEQESWEQVPFLIDDAGEYLYVREVCGCEAMLSGIWQINIATGEVTRLDTLVDLDSWFLSSLDDDARRLLAIQTVTQPSTEGPGQDFLPPATIRLLDLNRLEVDELLVDENRSWNNPWVDPEGNDRYVVRTGYEKIGVYLVNFTDTQIREEHYLTDGWVLDWVGDWLVVQDNEDLSVKLVNVESKEEIPLEFPGEQAEYIGSIQRE